MAYREAEAHQGHQYDNTRPAFGDLDAGLKAAFAPPPPKVSQSSLTHGATMAGCLGSIQQPPSTPPQLTPPPQKLPPPLTSQTAVNAKARAPKPPVVGQGPRRVSDSLTMALRRGKAKAPSPPAEKEEGEEETGDCSNSSGGHRYQNAQFGYNDEKVKVRPYAIALHSFVPQFDNELGFSVGDVVYLTRQVDADWMQGELSTGETGIFPKSYVNVIVDVSPKGSLGDLEFLSLDLGSSVQSSTTRTGFLEQGAIYKVAFSFTAETATDVSLAAGDEVTILSHTEENWANVRTSVGLEGQCPVNHLNTCPEPGMDVVRFVSQTGGGRAPNSRASSRPRQNNHLKFFDPLCSPDEEMLQIETELIRKATEKADIPVNPGITLHKNINLAPLNGERPRHRFKSSTMGKEQSIESFITQNLDGLNEIRGQRSHQCQPLPAGNQLPLLSTEQSRTSSDQQKQTFQISDSVRQELMDRMERNRKEVSALPSSHRLGPGGESGTNEKYFLGEEEMYQDERRRGDEMYEDPDSSSEFLPSSPCPCPEPISSEHLTSSDRLQSLESLYAKVNNNHTSETLYLLSTVIQVNKNYTKRSSLPNSRMDDCRSLEARSEESLSRSPSQVMMLLMS